jgi:hypothetical protein
MNAELELLPAPSVANPQLFCNKPDLVAEYVSLSDGEDVLHATRPPNLGITHEKAEHRLILYLKLEGFSNREVAARTGYTESWVSQVTRQPWFQKRLLVELNANGRTGLTEYLQVQVNDSFVKIVELRDGAKSETVQAACAMNIIDRVLGKPVQRSEVKMETSRKVDQVEDIRAAVDVLNAREKELLLKLEKYV